MLALVESESDLNTDAPRVVLEEDEGTITAKLTLGTDITKAKALLANDVLSSNGVMLAGSGFIISAQTAKSFGYGMDPKLDEMLPVFRRGGDLMRKPRLTHVIDLTGKNADDVMVSYPAIYSHVSDRVRPYRIVSTDQSFRDNWWQFGRSRPMMRDFLSSCLRYIATTETTKHRLFQFLDTKVRPDHMIVAIGSDRSESLAVLSSRWHTNWAIAAGGWLGAGNDSRYSKTRTFDPFPFPAVLTDPAPDDCTCALRDRLRELGERLETFRTERLAAVPDLTMTGLYNRLERYREAMNGGEPLEEAERADHDTARITILAELHDDIDRAVLGAYGWDDLAPALVGKPGGTTPSPRKSAEQEAAEDDLLTRLVALNRERAAEEARGLVRWLRPDYQIPKLGAKVPRPADGDQAALDVALIEAPDGMAWPTEPRAQFGAVRRLLDGAGDALPPQAIARAFKGRLTAKRQSRVDEVLAILTDLGSVRTGDRAGETLFFTQR